MKILHVLHSLKYSGAEIMYAGAAEEFIGRGCKLIAMATAKELGEFAPIFEKSGYEVIHKPYPKNIARRWRYYISMIKYLKEQKIDVVHIHDSGLKWGMSLVAKAAGIKAVYTFHSCFKSRTFTKPYHLWLRWSAQYIFGCKFQTISDSVYENELNYYHTQTTKVYNWYNNHKFYPATEEEKSHIREELGIEENQKVIISVGGCSPIKQHTEIIEILPELRKIYPDILYLHLGEGKDTEKEINLAKSLGVSDRVRFVGNTREVRKYLVASDVYLMTSRFEGIPITSIEAMACKIPALLYNVPGLRDFNNEIECSLLVEPNKEILIPSIQKIFESRKLRNALTENAYQLVTSKYYMPTNAYQIYQLYLK